jgi:hypothetical protein
MSLHPAGLSLPAADGLRGGLAALILTAAMQAVANRGEARDSPADSGDQGAAHIAYA